MSYNTINTIAVIAAMFVCLALLFDPRRLDRTACSMPSTGRSRGSISTPGRA
jgi:hypothetical protein